MPRQKHNHPSEWMSVCAYRLDQGFADGLEIAEALGELGVVALLLVDVDHVLVDVDHQLKQVGLEPEIHKSEEEEEE